MSLLESEIILNRFKLFKSTRQGALCPSLSMYLNQENTWNSNTLDPTHEE